MTSILHNLKSLNHKRGFTFIELAIAMTISLLATVAIFSTFITTSKMSVQSYMQNKTTMEARIIIDNLTSDVRMAINLESSFDEFTSGPSTLILKLPSINADGFAIDPKTKFDRVIYHQDQAKPNQIIRTLRAGTGSSRSSESRTIGDSFTPGIYTTQPDALGNFVIYYEFTSEQKRGDKIVKVPAAGSVHLRNHV